MKIYLDVCCLNRPFDIQYDDRIRIEAEAILSILLQCQQGNWQLISSDITSIEISKIQNINKKQKVLILESLAAERVNLNKDIEQRSKILFDFGIDLFDSLHIASAEKAKANVMLTTDDKLINKAKKIKDIQIRVENPVIWLMEVLNYENDN
ncbi:MAG TPA: type II toxin-antitoxin system VapC family toxin [Clostridiaceae bacterium]|jgi:predicted nucleic acid-binding protein|nr:type II toxin-antitoxin system VapC family toxin [Clostridiaceae bacterium]